VCDLETLWMRRPWPTGGLLCQKQTNELSIYWLIFIDKSDVSMKLYGWKWMNEACNWSES